MAESETWHKLTVFIGKGRQPPGARWLESVEFLTVSKKMTRTTDIAAADYALLEPSELQNYSIPSSVQVIGPASVVYVKARNRNLPKQPHPVFSYKFDQLAICCTGLDDDTRSDVRNMVRSMGGKYESDLDPCVTHLVASGWGSQKCHIARKANLPIVTVDWVRESFRRSSREEEKCFTLRPLQGLIVAVTELDPTRRAQAERDITQAGGRYTKEFSRKNTHLICPERLKKATAKHQAAIEWGCKVVSLRWLNACLKRRGCLDEARYQVEVDVAYSGGGAQKPQEVAVERKSGQKKGASSMNSGELGSIFDELGLFEPAPTNRGHKKSRLNNSNTSPHTGAARFTAMHDSDVIEETMVGFPSEHPRALRSEPVNSAKRERNSKQSTAEDASRDEGSRGGIESEGEVVGSQGSQGSQGSRSAQDFGFGGEMEWMRGGEDDDDDGITFC